jgi:hypothetical protein
MSKWYPLGKEGVDKSYAAVSQQQCELEHGQNCYDLGDSHPDDFDLSEGVATLNQGRKDERLAALALEAALQTRMSRQTKALRVIALIGHLNEQKSLTQEQVISFVSTYQSIQLMLLGLSIPTARAMIAAVTPDGVIVTQADKDALLAEIDS